jgi:hypothetical protein
VYIINPATGSSKGYLMEYRSAVRNVLIEWGLPMEERDNGNFSTMVGGGRVLSTGFVMGSIRMVLMKPGFYARADRRKTTLNGRKAAEKNNVKYEQSLREPMFSVYLVLEDSNPEELKCAMEEVLIDLQKAMDSFDDLMMHRKPTA